MQGCESAFIFCGTGSTVAVFLSADPDPDPAAFLMRIQIQFKNICKKI